MVTFLTEPLSKKFDITYRKETQCCSSTNVTFSTFLNCKPGVWLCVTLLSKHEPCWPHFCTFCIIAKLLESWSRFYQNLCRSNSTYVIAKKRGTRIDFLLKTPPPQTPPVIVELIVSLFIFHFIPYNSETFVIWMLLDAI